KARSAPGPRRRGPHGPSKRTSEPYAVSVQRGSEATIDQRPNASPRSAESSHASPGRPRSAATASTGEPASHGSMARGQGRATGRGATGAGIRLSFYGPGSPRDGST